MSTRFRWALGLAALGLVVRLPLLVGRSDSDSSDTVFYLLVSQDLLDGQGYKRAGMFYAPGYPIAFAILRLLPGRPEDAMAVLQHLLGLAVIVAIVLAGWRFFGRATALAAGTLAAVTPLLATSEHLLLPDFLFGVLVLAGGLLLAEASTRAPVPPLLLLALAGVCFGLATWVKPVGQFLLLAPPLALLFATRSPRATLRGSAVVALAMVLTISPWLYRNVDKYRSPTMSNQIGVTLYKRVFETDRIPFPQDSPYAGLARRTEARHGHVGIYRHIHDALEEEAGLTSEEGLAEMRSLAFTAIWRNPGDYALGTARAIGRFSWAMNHVDDRHDLPPELQREGRAVPHQITTWTWSAGSVLLVVWYAVSLGGLASVALLFVGEERSRRAAAALLSVWLAVMLGTVLTHGGLWRYSMQVVPIAFVLGSAGAPALWGLARDRLPGGTFPAMSRLVRSLLLALAMLGLFASAAPAATGGKFPRSFLWGTAVAGFQTEMGGTPANRDQRSDWWAWSHDRQEIAAKHVSGDLPERGPGHWRRWRGDVDLAAQQLNSNAFRMSVEWSRIFPRSTRGIETGRSISKSELRRLDRRANRGALRHYAAVIRRARRRGMTVLLTLNHFTLPNWIHDPIASREALEGRDPDGPLPRFTRPAGWLDPDTVDEFRKYAAYLAWKLGKQVDIWTPINEPLVVATNGYANVPGVIGAYFPPGAFSYTGAIAAVVNLERGNAAAYDAVKRWDRRSRVGLVQNLVAFTPANPASAADRRGAEHADYLFNRLFLNAALRGRVDRNANGTIEPSEIRSRGRRKADFVGVNYYFRGRVTGLPASISKAIPVLDFAPRTDYRTPQKPTAPPCPTECSEFGNEIYPEGLRTVLGTAGRFGLPVIITENGLADADDNQRPSHLVRHLRVLRKAMRDRVARVQGYLHWSLFDNFEWSAGYYPRFGLFRIDSKGNRRARPSARVFARIAKRNRVP